jgi:hypothetical protein
VCVIVFILPILCQFYLYGTRHQLDIVPAFSPCSPRPLPPTTSPLVLPPLLQWWPHVRLLPWPWVRCLLRFSSPTPPVLSLSDIATGVPLSSAIHNVSIKTLVPYMLDLQCLTTTRSGAPSSPWFSVASTFFTMLKMTPVVTPRVT